MGRRRLWLACLMLAVSGAACNRGPGSDAAGPSATQDFVARPDALRFPIAGRVVSVDPASERVTLAHDEIPDFMKAMTMEFAVKEAWALSAARPGSLVTGTLVVDGARTWIERVVVADPGSEALPPDPTAERP